ncbi:MAG TPA: cytochrome P460 family protein [Longimicrobiales bacterium]|nr:cytochrome P460 family protein [Longimicrobiales bacterium]
MRPAAPDTTAAALWAYLQDANYRSWPLFPGKSELYTGTEPHGMLLTTYVNTLALDALTNGAGSLPAGAIIVKENYMPDSSFAAATVMHKVTGYDAQNGDWFWAKYDANGVVEAAGRVAMCQQCHARGRARLRDDHAAAQLTPDSRAPRPPVGTLAGHPVERRWDRSGVER